MIGTKSRLQFRETRLAEEGLLKDVGAGYTFFWSGRKKEERREAGVGFAIKSHLVGKLSGLPKGIYDRLMTLRLPLSGKRHATIVSAYATTMTNPDEVKDKFYDDLNSVISATPWTDKPILLVEHERLFTNAVSSANSQQDVMDASSLQTAGQITGLLSTKNSTCAFSLHGNHMAKKCQRDWLSLS